jgi:hypothetical protein
MLLSTRMLVDGMLRQYCTFVLLYQQSKEMEHLSTRMLVDSMLRQYCTFVLLYQ